MLNEQMAQDVVEVKRWSARVMTIRILVNGGILRVISVYAPQTGRSEIEKEEFWKTIDLATTNLARNERLVVAGDWNGHVGEETKGYEGTHGGRGYGDRNTEGERILEYADSAELTILNTCFDKPKRRRVTYVSGEGQTQIDYILVAQAERKNVRNVSVIANEECVTQHRLLVIDWRLKPLVHRLPVKLIRIKTWRLRENTVRKQFTEQVEKLSITKRQHLTNVENEWNQFKDTILTAAKQVCGETKTKRVDRKPQLWNDTVKAAVTCKRDSHRLWYNNKTPENRKIYIQARRAAKEAVKSAIELNTKGLIEKLESYGTHARMFGVIRCMARERIEVGQMRTIRDMDGKIVSKDEEVLNVWSRHMERALNPDHNTIPPKIDESRAVEGPETEITQTEVRLALRNMKTGKAAGQSGLQTEMIRALGHNGLSWITDIFNRVWREGQMPKDWQVGIIVPVYKGKGDPMECNSYRPIKLLEHAMKVMERVMEKRLRAILNIDAMQRGFMPGRSTIDAIFTIRTLIERHLEKAKDIWTAFVDLEKAYDRVPRELIWWALRRQGVSESLINAVRTLYRGSVSTVKIDTHSGPQTGTQFDVANGVHQGSVLSPLLFITVMEEVTKKVRQGSPWELLFADDLALAAVTKEQLTEQLTKWKEALETAGLRVNVSKTKIVRFSRDANQRRESGKYPCGVCGKGVGVNSILCTTCDKWTHARCCGTSITKLRKNATSFQCSACKRGLNQPQVRLHFTDSQFELVDEFCYLGHVLEAEGGVQGAVRQRIRTAWLNWKKLSPVLMQKGLSLRLKGQLYALTVRSAMLYSAETWPIRKEELEKLERTQTRMLRWMAGVKRSERKKTESLRTTFGLDSLDVVMRRSRLRWFGNVARQEEDHPVKSCQAVVISGDRPVGRPRKVWWDVVQSDMDMLNISERDALDCAKWRRAIQMSAANPGLSREKRPIN
jgi:hypothetical protein